MTGKKATKDNTGSTTEIKKAEAPRFNLQSVPVSGGWIATTTLEYADENRYDTQVRLDILSAIIGELQDHTQGDAPGLIILPGGWIYTGEKKPRTVFDCVEHAVVNKLNGTDMTVCLGIDGGLNVENFAAEQVGLAINSMGIQAIGKKFCPSPQEKDHVSVCPKYTEGEDGFPRTFAFNGKTCFIAVCYDTYGVRQKGFPNPGADCVINLVHCFYPRGYGQQGERYPSSEVYFAKYGFVGASKQWECPVFGTAVFYHRRMPERWPSSVLWNCEDIDLKKWRYEYNTIRCRDLFTIPTDEGNVIVRIFDGEF